ncbi:MAG: hypothetical protein GX860_06670 [Alcaligenaceae bacterium]|jgi:hypothetical protein|nr:hypothetical protein [Alcaligenaceae bacterium]
MSKLKVKLSSLFEWINRHWILCTFVLTIVFWIVSGNILIGFIIALLSVVFLIMIHAIFLLNNLKKDE